MPVDEPELTRPPFVPGATWWACSYTRDGVRYAIDIPAASAAEAEAALHETFGTGTVDGETAGYLKLSEEEGRAVMRNLGIPPPHAEE